jgi:hypothetical protein
MKNVFLLTVLLYLNTGFATPPTVRDTGSDSTATPTGGSPFPLQLEARVPFAPTAFASAGRTYVVYELYVTNFSASPVTLRRLDVLDAQETTSKSVATFEGEQLDALLQPVGAQAPVGKSDPRQLGAGATIVAFMWIPFENEARVPGRLRHRLVTTNSSIEGAVIGTRRTELHLLAPPLQGAGWMASDGPSNDPENHHRRGILALNGQLAISRRYAIDWMLYKNGTSVSGDSRDKRSYYAYGKPVLAVADATVVKARDGLPDNVPGPVETFHPAVPITMDTVGGNTITLDLGDGQYAWYFHLQPGSLRVRTGEHVRRGQLLARIGCSGDPPVPHLHFEVTTSATLVAGEGIPYLIDHYRIWTGAKAWETRTQELPLRDMLVDFGQGGGGAN